ncbi:OsmC family protein [Falsibacillus albus]|uniref:OsmC family peroxiredoxin n=1 Tax=Falsibacillus albus TaxID=2478915 RepID=A0A3L7K7P3_9BACI|nr:OsmC family protein [Falsibacillus albus]RLQ96752.1 OsmC family peroxiredoxin [Falsibacillus albus]
MNFTLTDYLAADLPFGELRVSPDNAKGFRPLEMFVSAMAGCSSHVLKKILEKKRVEFGEITIAADVDRDADRSNRIKRLVLDFSVNCSSKDFTNEQITQLEKLVLSNCGMLQTITDSADVQLSIKFL